MKIIFDLDGTLINSEKSILATYQTIFKNKNLIPIIPISTDLMGPSIDEGLRKLLPENCGNLRDVLNKHFIELYDNENYKLTELYEGIEEMLEYLYLDTGSMYVATNKRESISKIILEEFGLKKYFERLYAYDSSDPPYLSKAAILKDIIRKENLNINDVAYVGDTIGDQSAAEECGVYYFHASWKDRNPAAALQTPNAVNVRTPLDLMEYIKLLKKRRKAADAQDL